LAAIRAEGLTRDYGRLRAVDHLDLSVERGELFALLGPNGAGKTTTIRLLTGLIQPTSGAAYVDSLEVSRNLLEVKSRVGVVPERSNLYNELNARENLIFAGKLYGLPRLSRRTRADELLAEFGLAERADAPFAALSGGMKRRLTIAAAMVHRPAILFLDEPTTGLDVQSARTLRAMIHDLRSSGVTLFLTTHLIAEAERLCDRVAILVGGNLVAVDTPRALRARCQSGEWLELVTPSPSEALLSALEHAAQVTSLSRAGNTLRLGVRSTDAALREIASITERYGASIEAIRSAVLSLEDAFVQLTGVDVETLQSNKPRSAAGSKRK
jgi:ABC-2 type transport system ATP-binding protein